MAERYKVTRMWVKHKGQIYREGDLLPEDFTHHDRFRNLHPRRIGLVEVSDAEITPPVTDPKLEGGQVPPIAPVDPPETPDAAKDTPTGDTEPPAEESTEPASTSDTPAPPATSEGEGSEEKSEEPSSEEEKADDATPEEKVDEEEKPAEVPQPPAAKPIAPVSGKATTGSRPAARPLSTKPTGAPAGNRKP